MAFAVTRLQMSLFADANVDTTLQERHDTATGRFCARATCVLTSYAKKKISPEEEALAVIF